MNRPTSLIARAIRTTRTSSVRSCLLLSAIMLSACGGGGATPVSTTPPQAANSAPIISGSPTLRTVQDRSYTFAPAASDADGDTLTFTIGNQPAWADFDPGTGTLSGTPSVADVGTTRDVSISVTDGELSASLPPFDLEVLPTAFGSATVFWDPPVTNADGSPLSDLAGFRIHYRDASGSVVAAQTVNEPTATSAVVNGLEEGTYFFSVTAVDLADNESVPSPEASKVIAP